MSSESFLPISDDVCSFWGSSFALHFSSFVFAPPVHTQALHGPNKVDLELCWCCFPTLASNRHAGANRAEFKISPQKRVYPSPYRGRGWVRSTSGLLGRLISSTNGSHGFYGANLGFAGVVSLPTPQTGHKSPHRAEFGFCSLTDSSPREIISFFSSDLLYDLRQKKNAFYFTAQKASG